MSTFSEFVKVFEDYNKHRAGNSQGELKNLQKHHWPRLMSIFSSSLQGPFLVMSPSNHLSFFKLCDIQTVPPIAFVHDADKDWGTLVNHEPQT